MRARVSGRLHYDRHGEIGSRRGARHHDDEREKESAVGDKIRYRHGEMLLLLALRVAMPDGVYRDVRSV